jgi:hypothetical protein
VKLYDPETGPGFTDKVKVVATEAGYLGLGFAFLASEVTVTTLMVLIKGLSSPELGMDQVQAIWDVFISTVPLTLAIAFITVGALQKWLNGSAGLFYSIAILVGAGLAANALHLGMPVTFFIPRYTGPAAVLKVLQDYLSAYGGLPFLKSLILGLAFGRWYLKLSS